MMTTNKSHRFLVDLFGETMVEGAIIEVELARLAVQAAEAAKTSGLSQRQIAARMGHSSPSTVQRLVSDLQPHNMKVDTLFRFARACKHKLLLNFVSEVGLEWESAHSSMSPQETKAPLPARCQVFPGEGQTWAGPSSVGSEFLGPQGVAA